MIPRIIAAMQAPTLLQRLSQAKQWRIETLDAGDSALQEASLCKLPQWDGDLTGVVAAWACSPAHVEWFQNYCRGVPIWWLGHNVKPELYPTVARRLPLLCFTQHSLGVLAPLHLGEHRAHVVPRYDPEPVWRWQAGMSWAMRSRPKHRFADEVSRLEWVVAQAQERRPHTHLRFGEGQPGGFVDEAGKRAVSASCSAYVSSLPPWTGIQQGEHEAMALGCPMITAPNQDYATGGLVSPCVAESEVDQVAALARCLDHPGVAAEASAAGLAYVARWHGAARSEESVCSYLEAAARARG